MITLQYLEPGPHIAGITPSQVRKKLQAAFARLPIKCLLLGWDIPPALEQVCRDMTARAGAKLYRWQPLLTGDGTLDPQMEWRTRNFEGQPLPGFRGLPEFTFICPNHPAARGAVLAHLIELAQSGRYDGIFLDRMRYPSPAADLLHSLSCFCAHCQNAAHAWGLNLSSVRRTLFDSRPRALLQAIWARADTPLAAFFDFRQHTITKFIGESVMVLRAAGLEVGLDCFAPTLTRMVGQDLTALAPLADWTKVMLYGHAFGPATLPFELTALANGLTERSETASTETLALLHEITGLPPDIFTSPNNTIARATVLADEYRRGQKLAPGCNLLAGIELVEMPAVSELHATQIQADLRHFKAAGAAGLSLSWDLWHIPLDRLDLVQQTWFP